MSNKAVNTSFFDTNLLQVVKLSKSGWFATNQPYFEKGATYYVHADEEQVFLSTKPVNKAIPVLNTKHGGKSQERFHYSMRLADNFCNQLGLVLGDSYIAVREALNGFVVTKATTEEIQKYGTKTHRDPVCGEIRHGNCIYFTPEQKEFLGIGATGEIKLQMRSKYRLVISPLSEADAKRLPTLREVYKKPRYTCKVKYPMAFKLPEQFVRNANAKVGDVLPMYFKGDSIFIEAAPHECSFCGKTSKAAIPVTLCEECTPVLESIQKMIRENHGDALSAARSALIALTLALKEEDKK